MINVDTSEVLKEKKTKKKKNLLRRQKLAGMSTTIMPMTVWMALFFIIPCAYIIFISFMSRGTYGGIEYDFTLDNYKQLFEATYMKIIISSLWLALRVTMITLCIGYPFALIMTILPKRYQSIAMLAVMVPFWTSGMIRLYAWIILLSQNGVINQFLMNMSIIGSPIQLLYTEGAVIVGMIYSFLPFVVLPLYSTLEKLDKSYIEAGYDLGSNSWQVFWHVIFPNSVPGILAASILVFVPSLGSFFATDLLGGGRTIIIGNVIQNQFLTARNWPFGAAMSVILIIITMLFILSIRKFAGKQSNLEVY